MALNIRSIITATVFLSTLLALVPSAHAATAKPGPIVIHFEGAPVRMWNPHDVLGKARRFIDELRKKIMEAGEATFLAQELESADIPDLSPIAGDDALIETMHQSVGDKKVCKQVEALILANPDRKVILLGHSYGGERAVRTAVCLDKKNIPVDGLITFDSVNIIDFLPFNPFRVPKNVRLNFHFLQRQDGFHLLRMLTGLVTCPINVRANGNASSVIYNFQLDFKKASQAHRYVYIKMYDAEVLQAIVDGILKGKPHGEIHAAVFKNLAEQEAALGFRATRVFNCSGSAEQEVREVYERIARENRLSPSP